ncbi:hypothetical protein EF917_26685, partial [Streptomyces sp. WAC00469]
MPGSTPRALKLTGVVAAVQTSVVLLATRAVAAPTPTPTPTDQENNCDLIFGEAKKYCERGNVSSNGDAPATPDPT